MLQNLLRAFVKFLARLKVHRAVYFLLKFMPASVQEWVEKQRVKLLVRIGRKAELVPAEDVKRRFEAALRLLTEKHPKSELGDYLEFGVYQGTSLRCMHEVSQKLGVSDLRLIGFDSFEGLPPEAESDGGAWQPGQFASSYEYTREYLTSHGINWDRVFLVKGWFNETLTDDLRRQHNIQKASVIMVDADLYSSAKTALDFCAPLIQDHAVIFFDDWNMYNLAANNDGEKRAFEEFLADNPQFVAEDFESYYHLSKAFYVSRKSEV